MAALALLAVMIIAGWFIRRTMILLLPLIVAAGYIVAVFGAGIGRDTPILFLAILAELGLVAGLVGRKYLAASR